MNIKSLLSATAMAAAVTAWMLSGPTLTQAAAQPEQPPSLAQQVQPIQVQIQRLHASSLQRHLIRPGQTEPVRQVTVCNETAGAVAERLMDKGAHVNAGDTIVQLKQNNRQAELQQAQAQLAQREARYQSVRSLQKSSYQSDTVVKEAFAQLQAARAHLNAVKLDIENTRITAPFDGILEELPAERGAYLPVNSPVAVIVDNDPLLVSVDISQHNIDQIRLGQSVTVYPEQSEPVTGQIRFIAAQAAPQTRTFRVEIAVPNPELHLAAGLTVEVKIPLDTVQAHFLSPALLSLDAEGRLGVKAVDADQHVVFHPISIEQTATDGVWVSGLPETIRAIQVGQGFVSPGEQVRTVTDTLNKTAAATGTAPLAGNDAAKSNQG